MTATTTERRVPAADQRRAPKRRTPSWLVLIFLGPAAALLGALVLYPIGFSIWRSLFNARGTSFIGLDNYARMFTDPSTFTALRNNVICVSPR